MAGTIRKIEALVKINNRCFLDFCGTPEPSDENEKEKKGRVFWNIFDVRGTFTPKINRYTPQITFDDFLKVYDTIQKETLKSLKIDDVYETKLEIKRF